MEILSSNMLRRQRKERRKIFPLMSIDKSVTKTTCVESFDPSTMNVLWTNFTRVQYMRRKSFESDWCIKPFKVDQ